MHRHARSLVYTILVLSIHGVALGADGNLAARIDAYAAPFVAAGHLSGSVLIARGNAKLYERSFGLANRELAVANRAETRFNIASITKPMTQIIAIRLMEGGRLAQDDKISKWLRDFPQSESITVEMLARHRAGIPHRVTTDIEETVPRTPSDMVELAGRQELLFGPGTDEAYSSAGYSVLARVLELASGKSYSELLEEHVFAPAGLRRSIHPTGSLLIPDRASSYRLAGRGQHINTPLKDYSFLVGAGSVFSTPGDLVAMMRAVVNGSYGELVRDQMLGEDGLSWNGRTNGYRAFADYDVRTDLYIGFTSNIVTGAGDMLRRDLPKLIAGDEVPTPVVPETSPVDVDLELLRSYEGDYELRPGTSLTLTVENGEVRMSGWLLLPTSETTFFSPQDYGVVTMIKDDAGSVTRLDWTVGEQTHPMPRVAETSRN